MVNSQCKITALKQIARQEVPNPGKNVIFNQKSRIAAPLW